MFESLSERLNAVFKKLSSRGRLTEDDVNEALREVRRALLEADVSLQVVKEFTASVREKTIGEELFKSMTPGQQVIKNVRDELIELMGSDTARLEYAPKAPTVFLVCGLHGAGKTTTSVKLANYVKSSGHQPLLVATDIYRPAAITQLEVLGKQIAVPVFKIDDCKDPVEISTKAIEKAKDMGKDVVIIDTAGRLNIDAELMDELKRQREAVSPQEILLVVDAMTGQDAVNVAKGFNDSLGITGVIMTKLDGDARGGAALSVKRVTGAPLKFVGVSEKISGFEPFHPDRMASRILGMGDILSLIEKAEQTMDKEKADQLQSKLMQNKFDLNDLLEQMQQIRRMGPLQEILKMLPGGIGNAFKDMPVGESQIKRIEAIIQAMTPQERSDPDILNASRRRRIAKGSGTQVNEVNALIRQYEELRKFMKGVTGLAKSRKGKRLMPFKLPF
ncbi:signal recognition particle protein [bacterium]|nr:signal recognition particle protein [bacterium]